MLQNILKMLAISSCSVLPVQYAFAESSAHEIKAIAWVKLKSETAQSSKICQDLKINCASDVAIWKTKASTDSKLYLTDDTPQLVELEKINQHYKIINHWNFKNYQHHSKNSPDDELGDYGTEIFPAFYPLNSQKQAIALVKKWEILYSGGNKDQHFADFIQLESNEKYKTALVDIPFYAYEGNRACFSEQDYKTSPHCDDESDSNLSIQFKDVGKPYYQWTLNYTDFEWAAFKPEKSKTITKSKVVVMPFGQK